MFDLIHNYGVLAIGLMLFVINVYGLVICRRFIDRLRSEHKSVWLGMGGPELINPENAFKANHLFGFIVFGKFYRCGDDFLIKEGAKMQTIVVASLVCLGALFVLLRGT